MQPEEPTSAPYQCIRFYSFGPRFSRGIAQILLQLWNKRRKRLENVNLKLAGRSFSPQAGSEMYGRSGSSSNRGQLGKPRKCQ